MRIEYFYNSEKFKIIYDEEGWLGQRIVHAMNKEAALGLYNELDKFLGDYGDEDEDEAAAKSAEREGGE